MKLMSKILTLVALLGFLQISAMAQADLEQLLQRMTESYITVGQSDPDVKERIEFIMAHADRNDVVVRELAEGPNDSLAGMYTRTLTEEGLWPDLDYTSQQRGAWPPAIHLERISQIARSYKNPDSDFYHKPGVSYMLHRALNKWFDMGLVCPNWWYNEIGGPRFLAPALLLLDGELSAEERQKAIKYMSQSKIGMTGQNRTWLAGNVLVRGLLERNEALVQQARDVIVSEIRVAPDTEEGIQPDASFHQHGPQQQFGNYGLAYILGITYWGKIFHGTHFALTPEQVEVLRRYVVEGLSKVIWKGMMDVNSCGRQLFPYIPEGKALAFGKVLIDMQRLDPGHAPEYRNLYNQLVRGVAVKYPNSGYTHFWNSDMSVQRRPEWFASLKMSSPRVIGTELVNGENLLNWQMADGALLVYKSGREYENIFPVWNYTEIPGITTNVESDTCEVFRRGSHSENYGSNPFAGGLEIPGGAEGISAMILEKNDLTARKAWFFGKEYIICRGTGITSPRVEGKPVRTTVAQQLAGDGACTIVSADGQVSTLGTGFSGKGNRWEWILHDGTGYWFPNGAELTLSIEERSGSWERFATMYAGAPPVTKDIFAVNIEHGYEPLGETYDYVILPDADPARCAEWSDGKQPFALEEAGDKVLAVDWPQEGRKDMVFFEAANMTFADGTTVSVSAPAIVSLSADGAVSVTDPTQLCEEINIEVKRSGTTDGLSFDMRDSKGRTVTRQLRR